MLYLVGIGLNKGDVTLTAIKTLKDCEKVYAEQYTGCTDAKYLEGMISKKIDVLKREKVESDFLIKEAESSDIALLVPGDPLTATTHMELILEARKQGIETDVIHAPSIFTAVAETGLHIYKFGRTTTLARPQENFHPESPYDIILENKKRGLHTLVLLEIDMPSHEAINILKQIDEKREEKLMNDKLVAIHFGEKNEISYGNAEDLELQAPCCLVFPGELHFTEEEALALWE